MPISANRSGLAAEDMLAAFFQSIQLSFSSQLVVGQTIYGTDYRVDFLLHNLTEFPDGLVVESKWQDVGGSVDEKFPYLLENIRHACPYPVVVIVHGGGCRPGAVEWLRARCDRHHLIAVHSLEGFMSWALRSNKSPTSQSSNRSTRLPSTRSTTSSDELF